MHSKQRIIITVVGGGVSYIAAAMIRNSMQKQVEVYSSKVKVELETPRDCNLTSSEVEALVNNYDILIREVTVSNKESVEVQGVCLHLHQWVFCNAVLQQIKKIEDGKIVEVYDGYGGRAGDLTDRCFPITVVNKRASETASKWIDSFSTNPVRGLNMPAIVEEIHSIWADICFCDEGSREQARAFDNLDQFCLGLNGRLSEITNSTVCPPSGREFKLIV